jgi:hypothetical protein
VLGIRGLTGNVGLTWFGRKSSCILLIIVSIIFYPLAVAALHVYVILLNQAGQREDGGFMGYLTLTKPIYYILQKSLTRFVWIMKKEIRVVQLSIER